MRIVFSYDVTDDRRRNRLAKRLKDYLVRVQYSVFEGDVDDREEMQIEKIVYKELSLDVDSVRIYHLCRHCASTMRLFGTSIYVGKEREEIF
jgi:CRISPR-associated protein Cas2